MRAGDTTHRLIQVINPATGAGVAGLAIGAFTCTAYGRGYGAAVWSTWTHAAALTDLGGGLYGLAFVAPPSAGWWRFTIVHASYQISSWSWEGECETQDLDSLYAAGSPYTITLSSAAELGQTRDIELVAYRYRRIDLVIKDANGDPVDLTTYSTLRLSVRSLDQSTIELDAQNGSPTGFVLTGDGAGNLRIDFPESTGAGAADIYAAIAAGQLDNSANPLYYEVTGDLGGDATKTMPIIRSSQLRLYRREVGS